MDMTGIIETLKQHWGMKTDSSLAEKLEVDRRSIHQLKASKSQDVKTKIIDQLLIDIRELSRSDSND